MGYAEAADAMTVAIRGFKLEMSDAQHITDVYSEVAAISASDTQELATAMSKTASSAASVGMSFENTTAMIATMVEATRESATNIGSAMKSIIARMSEMKAGLSQDENGEFLDASKVETALKSVGVALRDSQGQFRDLDIVIGELGAKWDSLDSATARYLATTIAGNRQQSRFLALMENYGRYTEIQTAAMNAEDASILQYAKTLDSLESKINQIRNSFQQFYMDIINGSAIGSFLDIINNIIDSLGQLPAAFSVPKILALVGQVKNALQVAFTLFSNLFSNAVRQMAQRKNEIFQTTPSWAESLGERIGEAIGRGIKKSNAIAPAIQEGVETGAQNTTNSTSRLTRIDHRNQNNQQKANRNIRLGTIAGAALQTAGLAISQNTTGGYVASNILQIAGGLTSTITSAFYNPLSAIVSGVSTIATFVSAISNYDKQRLENLKKETESTNIQRVKDKQAASDLQSYIEKEEKLRLARNESAEAEQAYIDLQNEIAEKYPQYLASIDESGNAIVNMSIATKDLRKAMDAAAASAANWAEKARTEAQANYDDALNKAGFANVQKRSNVVAGSPEQVDLFGGQYNIGGADEEKFRNVLKSNFGRDIPISDEYTSSFVQLFEQDLLENLPIKIGDSFDDALQKVLTYFNVQDLPTLVNILNELAQESTEGAQVARQINRLVGNAIGNQVIMYDYDKSAEKNLYQLSENYKNIATQKQALDSANSRSLRTQSASFAGVYTTAVQDSILERLDGAESIITQMVVDAFSGKESQFNQTEYNALADEFSAFYDELDEEQAEALQNYLEDYYSFSRTEFENILKDSEGNVRTGKAADALRAQFESFRKNYEDRLTENIVLFGENAIDISSFMGDLTTDQLIEFNSIVVSLYKQYENGGTYASIQIPKQLQLLSNFYKNAQKLSTQLRTSFLKDFGSVNWAKSFSTEEKTQLVQAGIIEYEDALDDFIYEQLNTYISNSAERLSNLATEFTSAIEKQSGSGFTVKEAKELVNTFHLDDFVSSFIYDAFNNAYYLTSDAQNFIKKELDKQLEQLTSTREKFKTLLDEKIDISTIDFEKDTSYTPQEQDILVAAQKAATKKVINEETGKEESVLDRDTFNQILEEYIQTGQISINDATNQLFALNIKDIQTAEQYVNSKDKRTADAAKAYVEEFYDYAANLTGKVTADQISKLSTYGIDTTLIKVGDEWNKAIEYIGNERVKSIAKAAQAYSREEMKTKLSSGLQDIFTSVVSGEEVAANDIADLVESALGRSLNSGERDAIEKELKESPQLLMDHLEAIITASLRSQGVDEEEIQKILTELTITVVETISTAIEDGVSLLAKGITDGISQSELKQLSNFFKVNPDQIASYDQSTGKYRTSGEQFISTLITSPMMKGRDTYAYSRQLTETLGGKGGVLGSYESITKEIERVEKNIKKSTDQEKARLKILKEMQAVYANIADSQRFDFMGYDMMQGQMDDFDNWIDSIQQVQDVFQGLSDNDGKMNYKNFLSMIDYIQKFHPDASSLQIAGQSLDQFAVAIMNTVDIAGNVDFSKVADAMTQGVGQMADAMKETLAEVARERIKTLEATKAALVAQLAVEKALEAMDGKLPTVEWDGEDNLKSIQNWKDTLNNQAKAIIDTMDDLTEEQKAASKAYLDAFPLGQQVLDALGFTDEQIANWTDKERNAFNQIISSLNIPDMMRQAIDNVQASGISFSDSKQLGDAYFKEFQRLLLAGWKDAQTEEIQLEAPNAKIVGDTQIEAPSTTTTSTEAKDTTKALTDTAAAIDKAEEAFKNLGQTGQEEIEKIKTAITDLTTQLDGLKESFNLGATETPMEIQLKAVIGEYTNAPGIDPNKQVENLNGTVGSFAPTAEGETSKKSLVDSLVATVSSFLPATGVDANSLVSDLTAIVSLSSNPEELYKNIVAYMSTKKVDVAVQLANSGNEQELATLWPNLSTVEQALVQVITQGTAAETAVSNVIAKYGTLGAASLATGMLVGAAESSNQSNLAKTGEAVDSVSTMYGKASTAAGNASTTIAETEKANQDNIEKTGDAAGIAKKKIADMARGEHKIKVNANTKPAIMAANQAVQDIEAKSATIRVTSVYTEENAPTPTLPHLTLKNRTSKPSTKPEGSGSYIGGGGGGGKTLMLWEQGHGLLRKGGFYQGTVNDLGPAYAQGTKTLVGELGPELAVYDNAYHLLGRNGAELVDIPDDAIIFNHKQTEGILKGQANNGRGKTVNGQPAFATGNVGGPAYAGGLSGAIAAIDREIMAWKALLSMTTADLLGSAGGGGGGGGSGNTLKAHIEDLVEWYNLTRQIADIEQKINNIIAKRANITDGRAYLKSLREQQHLLEGQALVQKTLLGYQQKQLELQAEQINTHDIWKQFFHVGSDGLLQYNMGNEVNGGKGTLTLLQQLNQMSGADQLSYIKNLGYSYITNDGEQLDGEDLISQFFEEAQAQIDKYDELRDTVEETDEALSKLESSINEIEQEIRDNQKELEEIIYNTLVEAWEKQISQLQEQTDMLREANEAYVNGLNDALNKERNQYSQNKSISDRQQLQRQLSLLRRSGGSASQIASLEEQLNSALKEEYFSHQQETIDSIKEANDKQLDALNKQITLQQETLDFQKENGVLWTKVYEVLSQSDGKIMEFLIQNSSEFIQASALAQADMLNEEWAKRIGIYKANSEEGFEPYVQKANQMFATEAWNSAEGPQKQSMFNALDVASQKALQDYFASAFANEMLRNGGNEAAAYEVARQDMYQKLYQAYNQMKNIQNTTLDAIRNISQPSVAPKDNTAGTGGGSGAGGSNAGGGSKDNSSSSTTTKPSTASETRTCIVRGNGGGAPEWAGGGTSIPAKPGRKLRITPNPAKGFTTLSVSYEGRSSSSLQVTVPSGSGPLYVTVHYRRKTPQVSPSLPSQRKPIPLQRENVLYADSGALVGSDDTPAILHKGEGVFTAGETSALRSMVKNYQTLAANLTGNSLLSAMSSIGSYSFSNTRNAGSELNINPGAVVIHVDKLDDKYDVDELATDVFNKLSTIASKATNRGVNRR